MRLSEQIISKRWLVVACWVALAAALIALVPPPPPNDEQDLQFLPGSSPFIQAQNLEAAAFPDRSGASEATILFERANGLLTDRDLQAIEAVAQAVVTTPTPAAEAEHLARLTVRSPGSIPNPQLPVVGTPIVRNPLISTPGPEGQAALVVVRIPSNYITLYSYRMVEHVRHVVASAELPEGLQASVTGSAGFGHGYAKAAEESHHSTTIVTLAAVVIILLLVYRAPLAALVPLVAISLAALVVVQGLKVAEQFGVHAGLAEKIFLFVLMYGAGIDYSLLLISRFRENLTAAGHARAAAAGALRATFPAILASAVTDAAGLFMMVFAQFRIFTTTGPIVAVALIVAMLSSLTLVPALVAVFGRRMDWPSRLRPRGQGRVWPRIAGLVTRRPGRTLVITSLLLTAPAIHGARLDWLYDTLAGFTPRVENGVGNASYGTEVAQRHWPVGEVGPTVVLIHADQPLGYIQWGGLSERLSNRLARVRGIGNVRSFNQPLGWSVSNWSNALIQTFGGRHVADYYVSDDRRTMRLEVIMDDQPMSREAIESLQRVPDAIGPIVDEAAEQTGRAMTLHYTGPTAEVINVRDTTQSDFLLVGSLAMGVIFLTVLVLLRDPLLTAFMLVTTLVSYFATLGLTDWVLAGLLGMEGLDWKIEILLFVVMVAVGVDYNIFLASRMAQESKTAPPVLAVRRAVISTGPVISSCGLIMAATLGALMAGELKLLHQLGFAMALGMLIDTFVMRPLMLPAFACLTGRTGAKGMLPH